MTHYTDQERADLQRAAQVRSELEQTEDAFDLVREELMQAWASSTLADAAVREQLYMGVNILDRVRQALRMAVAGGDMAQKSGELRRLLTEQGGA